MKTLPFFIAFLVLFFCVSSAKLKSKYSEEEAFLQRTLGNMSKFAESVFNNQPTISNNSDMNKARQEESPGLDMDYSNLLEIAHGKTNMKNKVDTIPQKSNDDFLPLTLLEKSSIEKI